MSMFEKAKLWFLTPENREKYLLEKEKKERAKKRNLDNSEIEDETETETQIQSKIKDRGKDKSKDKSKDKPKDKSKDKEKSSGGLFGSKKDNKKKSGGLFGGKKNQNDEVEDENLDLPKKKVKVVKVVKTKTNDQLNDDVVIDTTNTDEIEQQNNISESKESIDTVNSMDLIKKQLQGDSEVTKESNQTSLSNSELNSQLEPNSDIQLKVLQEEEEKRKKELVKKKLEEKEKYMDIMIGLPPTSDVDKIIKNALSAGVPEWFLREEGYLVGDDEEESVSNITDSSVNSEEDTEEDIVVDTEVDTKVDTEDDIEVDIEVDTVVDTVVDDKDLYKLPETIPNSNEQSIDAIKEKSSTEEEGQMKVPSDSKTDTSEKVNSDSNRNQLAERLKRIAEMKVRREVLQVDGDTVLVKEEKEDSEGNKKLNYKNYKVEESEASKIEVGKEIDLSIKLEKAESKTYEINGEAYNISKEDEERISREIEKKEIWLITTNLEWVDELSSRFKETRYNIYAVKNEKDFLLSTRSIDNTVVITQQIPSEVKSSISAYLKYLELEKKNSRLVSVSSSPVKAKIIEHVFDDITVEELDNYYKNFESSRYSLSKKTVFDILKVISFDITDNLKETVSISVDEEFEENDLREIVLDDLSGNLDLFVDVDEENSGDLVLEITDSVITLEDNELDHPNKDIKLSNTIEIEEE